MHEGACALVHAMKRDALLPPPSLIACKQVKTPTLLPPQAATLLTCPPDHAAFMDAQSPGTLTFAAHQFHGSHLAMSASLWNNLDDNQRDARAWAPHSSAEGTGALWTGGQTGMPNQARGRALL